MYEIATNPKYDGYQRTLVSIVYLFFDKKTGSRARVNEEINKPVIKNFKRRKVHTRFKDKFWPADFFKNWDSHHTKLNSH